MANTEFTTASASDAMSAQTASLESVLSPPDAANAPTIADARTYETEAPPPATFKTRQLKISSLPLAHEAVPFVRMSGKWLAEAGFQIGGDIRVAVTSHRLVIETEAPEIESKQQIREKRRAALKDLAQSEANTASTLYPPLPFTEIVREPPCDPYSEGAYSQQRTKPNSQVAQDKRSARANSAPHSVRFVTGTWPKWIAATLEPIFGDLLSEERHKLDLTPVGMASYVEIDESQYRALDRGDRQPNLSVFIAIAWTLGLDPRVLLDKLLLRMGFPTGARPILRQETSRSP